MKRTPAHHGICSTVKDMYRISNVVFLDLDFVSLQWTKLTKPCPYALLTEKVPFIALYNLIIKFPVTLIPRQHLMVTAAPVS